MLFLGKNECGEHYHRHGDKEVDRGVTVILLPAVNMFHAYSRVSEKLAVKLDYLHLIAVDVIALIRADGGERLEIALCAVDNGLDLVGILPRFFNSEVKRSEK